MTIRTSNEEAPCTHEATNNQFNQGQIMQCIVMYATGLYL